MWESNCGREVRAWKRRGCPVLTPVPRSVCVSHTHTHLSHLSLTSGPLCRAVSLCWASDLEPRVPGKGTGGVQAWVLVGARCSLTPVWLHL